MKNNLITKIPTGWEVKELKYVLSNIMTGGTPSTDKAYYYDNNGKYAWVSISDITKSEGSLFVTEKRITQQAVEETKLPIIPKGTLLISIFASLGKTTILETDAVVNQAILGLIPDERYTTRDFLKWYLSFTESFISYYSSSNTQDNLNLTKIRNLPFICPPLSTQQKIATFLDQKTTEIDNLISKKNKMISLLKEEEKAFINEKLQEKTNWTKKKLKYLVKLRSEKVNSEDLVKYDLKLALENMESFTGNLVNLENETSFQGEGRYFAENDVLFSKLRPYLSKYYLAKKEGICFGELLIFIPNQTIISPDFLYYLISNHKFIHNVDGSTYGSKMPRASWEDFISHYQFYIPSLSVQSEIVSAIGLHLSKSRLLIEKSMQEVILLKEYRQSLISECVSGGMAV